MSYACAGGAISQGDLDSPAPTAISPAQGGNGSGATIVPIPDNIDAQMKLASGFTDTASTPLGDNYVKVLGVVPTQAQLSFLKDPAQQPSIPNSAAGLILAPFPVTLYPAGEPSPADINQHALGNCNGDSGLAGLANSHPDFIKKIIKDNHNGTFTVSMFDPKGAPMTVSVDSKFLAWNASSIGAVSSKNNVAAWTTVMEKAALKYLQVYPVTDDIGGISSEAMLPMFTGNGSSFAFAPGSLTPEEMTQVVAFELAHGATVNGGFKEEVWLGNDHTVTMHGYAVFFPSDKDSLNAMRNPWGVSPTPNGYDGSEDGVLNVPGTKQWSSLVDLRIVEPGVQGDSGNTQPYVMPAVFKTDAQ